MLQEIINELVKAQSAIKENEQMKVEIRALEENVEDGKKRVREMQSELDTAHEQIDSYENSADEKALTCIDLGLDKIYYRLDNNNLQIRQRLESALQEINTIPNSLLIFQ